MRIGVNTYGQSGLLSEDFDGTLQFYKECGVTDIEACIYLEKTFSASKEALQELLKSNRQHGGLWLESEAPKKLQKLRDAGFRVTGAHLMIESTDLFFQNIADLQRLAADCQLDYLVYSPHPACYDHMEEFCQRLRDAVVQLKKANVELLVHNHSKEYDRHGDAFILDRLLSNVPELTIQLDVGWAQYAGVDAAEEVVRLRDRISILHFKDFSSLPKEPVYNFCAVGEGVLPLTKVMQNAKACTLREIGYVLDQDRSLGDMRQDTKTGINNLLSYLQ